jgi:hypothetical protein
VQGHFYIRLFSCRFAGHSIVDDGYFWQVYSQHAILLYCIVLYCMFYPLIASVFMGCSPLLWSMESLNKVKFYGLYVARNNKRTWGLDVKCPILTKFGVSRQIFLKVPSTKFYWNPCRGRHTDRRGQTDVTKRIKALLTTRAICSGCFFVWFSCQFSEDWRYKQCSESRTCFLL